jgi:putative FmdB family regulatory protein
MPVFEYRCGTCKSTSEQLVLAGDIASAPECPSCGSTEMSRLLSTFAAQASHGNGTRASSSFDASTACGGGACRMPDVCGGGGGYN